MRKSELTFTALLVPLDFVMLVLAGLLAWWLRTSSWIQELRPVQFYTSLPFEEYFILIAVIALFMLFVFALVGLYAIVPIRKMMEDFYMIVIGVSAGIIVLVFYIFIRSELFDSRFLVLGGWLMAILMVTLGRYLISRIQRYLIKRYQVCVYRVLVIGKDEISRKIISHIKKEPAFGCVVAANLREPDIAKIEATVKRSHIEEIILADPDWPKDTILELVQFCDANHLSFKFVPNLFQTLTSNVFVEGIGGVPLVELKRTALDGWGRIVKRLVDIIGSVLGLILLSPFFLIMAIIIKSDSEGPVFYKPKRISQNKKFRLYKFRSMVKGAEAQKKKLLQHNERKDGPLFKMKDDPRITKVGKFIRKTRIDELPQLLNVLIGQISLVGPRPHQPDEIAHYKKHHKKVLAIKSGMTGMAQVSGSSDLSFEDEVKLDTFYIENWSLFLDLKIFLKTLVVLWRDRSAV